MGICYLFEYLNKYDVVVGDNVERIVSENNKETTTTNALDLPKRLLKYDHWERLTAKEAMNHSYFRESESNTRKF